MSCLIHVEFKKDSIKPESNLIFESVINDEIYVCHGNGIIIMVKDEYYIFTCNHIIEKYTVSIECHTDEIIFNPTIFKRIYEYDVCILKINFHDSIHLKKYYRIENIGDINSFSKYKNFISHNLEKSCEIVKNICIKNHHIKSVIVPKIPMYEFELNKSCDAHGLSGSVLTNDENILGMVVCKLNKIIMAIPLLLILNFMNNHLKYIKFNYDFVDFTLDKKYNGLYINNIINKKYNDTLNLGDVVVSCENQEINDDGEIYCDEIKLYVTIDTFIMLNNKNYVDITILNSKETFENIICFKYDIELICKIFIQKQNKYINLNGLIFTELSEELMIENIKKGMNYYKDIYNSLFDNYENEKYIVLILNINSNKKYNKFVHMPLLQIEKHKIFNIDDLVTSSDFDEMYYSSYNHNKINIKKLIK